MSIITTYLLNKYLYTEEYYSYTLQENFTDEQIQDFITNKKNAQWLILIKTPLMIILKTIIVTMLIIGGLNLYEHELDFSNVLKISLLAEFIFILLPLIRLLWFIFFEINSFEEIIRFPTFSVIDLVNQDQLSGWMTYPLKVANLFELIYILLLSELLSINLRVTFKKSLKIILSSYGIGLILWVVIVSFILVNLGM